MYSVVTETEHNKQGGNIMYYAELDTGECIDLWRFPTKEERNVFVENRPSTAYIITYKEAAACHKEQIAYWKSQEA